MGLRRIDIDMNAGEGWVFFAVDVDLHLLNAVIVLLYLSKAVGFTSKQFRWETPPEELF